MARNPETKLEVGAVGPGEEGEWTQREEEVGGLEKEGEMDRVDSDAGCLPGRGPTPWSVSGPARARESEGPPSRVSALDSVRGAVWTPPRGPCGTLPKRETASLLLFARWWVFLSV